MFVLHRSSHALGFEETIRQLEWHLAQCRDALYVKRGREALPDVIPGSLSRCLVPAVGQSTFGGWAKQHSKHTAGVGIVGETREEPYGRVAAFIDIAGNGRDLVEPRPSH